MRKITNFLCKLIELLLCCLLVIISLYIVAILIFTLYIAIAILMNFIIELLNILALFGFFIKFIFDNLKLDLDLYMEGYYNDRPYISLDYKPYFESSRIPSQDLRLHDPIQGSSVSGSGLFSEIGQFRIKYWRGFTNDKIINMRYWNLIMHREIGFIRNFIVINNITLERYERYNGQEIRWVTFVTSPLIVTPEDDRVYVPMRGEPLTQGEFNYLEYHIKNYIAMENLCDQNATEVRISSNREFIRQWHRLNNNKREFRSLIQNVHSDNT